MAPCSEVPLPSRWGSSRAGLGVLCLLPAAASAHSDHCTFFCDSGLFQRNRTQLVGLCLLLSAQSAGQHSSLGGGGWAGLDQGAGAACVRGLPAPPQPPTQSLLPHPAATRTLALRAAMAYSASAISVRLMKTHIQERDETVTELSFIEKVALRSF